MYAYEGFSISSNYNHAQENDPQEVELFREVHKEESADRCFPKPGGSR